MHQRAWLSLITFPLVATFTYPVVFRQAPVPAQSESRQVSQDPLAGLSDIQDVLSLVRDNYVDAPDMDKVISGGIQAALEQAHPWNAYLSPEDLRLPDPGPAQTGLIVLKKDIVARVMDVIPGSPADKAGIRSGDVIRKIDGESIGFLNAWSLERKLRGAAGSEITLTNYASGDGQLKKIVLKREVLPRAPIAVRKEAKASVVSIPDLKPGRASELKALLPGLDHAGTLVLDLRSCAGGDLAEAAQVAGFFAGAGTLATIQEAGKPDQSVSVLRPDLQSFHRFAVLQGIGSLGASEALVAFLKKQSVPTFGDRTAALGVQRTRVLLRQGGAVELVNRRWLGAGGEKLDRQGVQPEYPLRNLQPGDDPLPKVLEQLDASEKSPGAAKKEKVACSRNSWEKMPPAVSTTHLTGDREVA